MEGFDDLDGGSWTLYVSMSNLSEAAAVSGNPLANPSANLES